MSGHISPEGIDWACGSDAAKRSIPNNQPYPDGMDMADFWADIEVIDTEYTMVSRRRLLGGQYDLMYRSSEGVTLLDVKTKSASWRGASGRHRQLQGPGRRLPVPAVQRRRQAEVHPLGGPPPNSVITPTKAPLPPMQPDQCSLSFEDCWGTYSPKHSHFLFKSDLAMTASANKTNQSQSTSPVRTSGSSKANYYPNVSTPRSGRTLNITDQLICEYKAAYAAYKAAGAERFRASPGRPTRGLLEPHKDKLSGVYLFDGVQFKETRQQRGRSAAFPTTSTNNAKESDDGTVTPKVSKSLRAKWVD